MHQALNLIFIRMKLLFTLVITCIGTVALSQPSDSSPTHERDIAFGYYQQKEYDKALEAIKPLMDRSDADQETFKLAANIYDKLDQPKEAEKIYKRGIKKFSPGGFIYDEYGDYTLRKGDSAGAIKLWEKGIESDPTYPGNYFEAAKYYYLTGDLPWSMLYGEIYINLENTSGHTPEARLILLDVYKRFFEAGRASDAAGGSAFIQGFTELMGKQSELGSGGINPETLSMIRARFILEWYTRFNNKYPFKLFEYQRQLLRDGLFEAYNYWLFGPAYHLPTFQSWALSHKEFADFVESQKSAGLKVQSKQYYHK